MGNSFSERMAEYAYAAQLGKRNIYLSFAVSITPGCDCEGHDMAPSIPDIGVFASLDPVAIDRACLDKAKALGKRFRGEDALVYAEGLGLGSRKYVLIG